MNTLFKNLLLAVFFIGGITACIDQEFDEPPVDGEDPDIEANATIIELKALFQKGTFVSIQEDIIIQGIVVADDRSGNFFRTLILQDATAGIEILINQTNAYNLYPIGRQLFVKCKGLVIGEYNGVIQLGGYTYVEDGGTNLGDINDLNTHIVKGKRMEVPAPKVKKINELTEADISTLVKLENVEFASADVGLSYADPIGRQSINRTIKDCNGGSIILRSSGFATFAGNTIPEGNGSLTAIYSVFGQDKQLFIRELTDVEMNGTRCSGSVGNEEPITIQEIRNLFKSGVTVGPDNRKIRGIVISDKDNGNLDSRNLVVQDATGGIVVRFQSNHNFTLGQDIEVAVSGQELSEFNGLLQVNGVSNELAKSLGAGTLPTPREAKVSEIIANLENWESTLVLIKGATIAAGNYSGSRNVSDGSGTIVLFTRSQASFSGQAVPSGTVDITAIVSQFNTPQIIIRNTSDITGGNGGGGGGGNTSTIDESFSSQTNNQDIAIAGWKNIVIKGTRKWRAQTFSGNFFAQATAFQDTNDEMETWLITPGIDLTEAKVLSFESAQAFFVHDGLSVWISNDFDGSNVGSATWKQLNCTLATNSNANYDWVQSGNIDLSAFSGTAYIGFKYVGNKTNQTTTYRIDNVKVVKK